MRRAKSPPTRMPRTNFPSKWRRLGNKPWRRRGRPRRAKFRCGCRWFLRRAGTVFPVLRRLAGLGLGGSMAGGRQFVSWIHQEDFCRAVEWILAHPTIARPVQCGGAESRDQSRNDGDVPQGVRTPFGLPAARWMLEIGAFAHAHGNRIDDQEPARRAWQTAGLRFPIPFSDFPRRVGGNRSGSVYESAHALLQISDRKHLPNESYVLRASRKSVIAPPQLC